MPDSPTVFALLVAAGLLAGWVDAVVLLGLPGAAPAQLLATNKIASICGTSVSAAT